MRRLRLLRSAQRSGRPIGDRARLSNAQIVALVHQAGRRELSGPLIEHVLGCQRAIENLDPRTLTAVLNRTSTAFGHVLAADAVIAPVMEWVGAQWAAGELRPEHEHLALATQRPSAAAPTLVAGTLNGEQHELGALTAAVVAAAEGWRVAYLGAEIPAAGMIATATAHRAPRPSAVGGLHQLDRSRQPE